MDKSYFFIDSNRLRLIPLNFELLKLYFEPELLAQSLSLKKVTIDLEEPFKSGTEDAIEAFWKPNTLAYPEYYPWYTNWLIVLKSSNRAIGGIGLAGRPNDKGETETGYVLDLNHRNQGYATEALKTMVDWVFSHDEVAAIIAHTHKLPSASQKVLTKCGFINSGSEITEDGDVYLWRKYRSED